MFPHPRTDAPRTITRRVIERRIAEEARRFVHEITGHPFEKAVRECWPKLFEAVERFERERRVDSG